MPGHGRRDADDVLSLALATGLPIAKAAERAKISTRTVRRRLSDAAFRNRVHELRSELIQSAVGRLAGLGRRAANELNRLIKSSRSDQVRLGAARAVLQYLLSGHENEILAHEVAELAEEIQQLKSAAAECSIRPHARHAQNDNAEPAVDPPRLFAPDSPENPFISGA
jgi:hypothetical protein